MAEVSDFEKKINAMCEELGEAEVRKRLRMGVFGQGKKRSYVEGWLERLEAERSLEEREAKSSKAIKQIELAQAAADAARDAADAARDQADAAREANDIAHRANKIATLALIAAGIAVLVSIAGLFL